MDFFVRAILVLAALVLLYSVGYLIVVTFEGGHASGSYGFGLLLAVGGLLLSLTDKCGTYGGCFPWGIITGVSAAAGLVWTLWSMRPRA